jgi:hypothetical protein
MEETIPDAKPITAPEVDLHLKDQLELGEQIIA